MYRNATLLIVALGLVGCGEPGADLSRLHARSAQFKVTGEAFLNNTLSISGCPPGTYVAGRRIDTSVVANVTDTNFRTDYQIGAYGNRSNRCE